MDGNFVRPIGAMFQGKISVNSSTPVLINADGSKFVARGRQAVEVFVPTASPISYLYVGNENVKVGEGAVVEHGKSRIFPVASQGASAGMLYMIGDASGDVIVCEYTE